MRCEDSGMFSQLNTAVDYVKLREYVFISIALMGACNVLQFEI